MTNYEFEDLFADTIVELGNLLHVKGGEYASNADRLSNFHRGATLTGIQPLTVLFVYMSKHYDAVATYIRDQEANVDRVRSESIEGRLYDLMNYCMLALAIIKDEHRADAGAVNG